MEVVNPRCCGLDVHKKTVVACVITPEKKETRTFSTMTNDLFKLKEWLRTESEPCGHGEHRRSLEAGLQPVGGCVHRAGAECLSHQDCAGQEDRR